MDRLLRLAAGFHPASPSRVGSDTSERAAPPLRQQVWGSPDFPKEGKELGKRKEPRSSRRWLGRCRKSPRALGLAAQPPSCGPAHGQGRTLAVEPCPRSFAPAKQSAPAVVAMQRCPLGVSGWVRVGGCFPAVVAEALPTHAGDTTSPPVIACPGICSYVLRAV